jgi:hypothetical protein
MAGWLLNCPRDFYQPRPEGRGLVYTLLCLLAWCSHQVLYSLLGHFLMEGNWSRQQTGPLGPVPRQSETACLWDTELTP